MTPASLIDPRSGLPRLRLPIPPEVREAVLLRAGGYCEDCGIEVRNPELHHLTYYDPTIGGCHQIKHGPFWIFGKETSDDLLALCRDCHLSRHVVNGEFYADPEEADAERDYLAHVWNKDD